MATIKFKEIVKMSDQDRVKRFKELKLELAKAQAGSAKTGSSKAKETRKIIARIHTFNTSKKATVSPKKEVLKK